MPPIRLLVAALGAALLAAGLAPTAASAVVAVGATPRTAAAPAGTLVVTPSADLDRAGETVSVTVSGVPDGSGIYLQWCPGNPAGTRWPAGTCASSPQVWASSSATAQAQGASALAAQPFTLALTPTITTAGGTLDCRTTACAVFVRLDHFSPGDTSLDRFVPVGFAAAPLPTPTPSPTTATPTPTPTPTPEAPAYAVSVTPTSGLARTGGTVAVSVTGLSADQGVYVRLCALGPVGAGRPAADACDGQGRWVRESYPYGPYPTDGSVVRPSDGPVILDVRSAFGTVDCTEVTCGVHVRRDHLAPADTSLDRAIPLTFGSGPSTQPSTAPTPGPTAEPTSSPSPSATPDPSTTPTPSPSPTSSGSATLRLDRATAAPGDAVVLDAAGFTPGERVVAELHSTPVELGSTTADGGGDVRLTVTVPATAEAGEHTVVLTGQSSGRSTEAALVVISADSASGTRSGGSDGTLASTGAPAAGLVGPAAVLLLLGAALVLAAARRRTAP